MLQMAVKLTVSLSIQEGLFTYVITLFGLDSVGLACLYRSQTSGCYKTRSLISLVCSDLFDAALVYKAMFEISLQINK